MDDYGTIGVRGRGETGKMVTLLPRIIVAFLLGWKVTICDPYQDEGRPINDEMEPFAP